MGFLLGYHGTVLRANPQFVCTHVVTGLQYSFWAVQTPKPVARSEAETTDGDTRAGTNRIVYDRSELHRAVPEEASLGCRHDYGAGAGRHRFPRRLATGDVRAL